VVFIADGALMTGDKTCPACDSRVAEGDAACPQCGVLLGIFDSDVNAVGIPGNDCEPAVNELFDALDRESGAGSDDTITEKVILIGRAVPVSAEQFICPSCGTALIASATSCPKCGTQFAEEGSAQFQCPICSTMVNADATKCPGCGAEFAEEKKDDSAPAVTDGTKEETVEARGETKEKEEKKELTEEPVKETAPVKPDESDKEMDGKKKKVEHTWTRFIKRKNK